MAAGEVVKLEGRREAATVDAATLDGACFAFDRAYPQRSARRVLFFTQGIVIAAVIGGLVWACAEAPSVTSTALHYAALALFACAILWRLLAASSLTPLLSRLADPPHFPTYTILCPLYREAKVVPDLVAALSLLDYPASALDIKLLVEGDDPETIAAAFTAARQSHVSVVIVPPSAPRTKPKALNAGLAQARGEFVTVYDAEDRPHPQQLRAALAAFEDGGDDLVCVQAPLSIDNADVSWIARQFAAEYAIQFREMLPFLARLGLPLPLGGTSNHFRTADLRASGGWDPYNVSEDRAIFASKLNRFRTRAFHIPFVSQSCASAA